MDSAVDRRVGGQARKCRDFGQDRSKDIGRAARWGDLVGDPQPVDQRGKPPLMRVPEVGVTAQRGDVRCGDAGQAVTPVLRAQRRSGIRRFCGKTACCFRRKLRFEERASAFPIRLCAFAAVQEKS